MFVFAHIFSGTVLGLVFFYITGERRFIPFCIAGAILPDFIDKPLGYILLPQVLDSGRTFFHSLVIAGTIILLALIVYRCRRTVIIAGFAAALLVHQLLDAMWQEPVTWFYPLLGQFQPFHYADYFTSFFWLEITSVSEWVFLFASLMLLAFVYRDKFKNLIPVCIRHRQNAAYYAALLLLCITGAYALATGIPGWKNVMAPYNTPEDNLIMGAIAVTGCGISLMYMLAEKPGNTGALP